MGKRVVALIFVLLGLALVGYGVYRYYESRKPNAGLKVETNPPSMVFVDNNQIGETPIEQVFQPGEVTIKLVPSSTSSAMMTYQTKVKLNSKTYTVVKRDFGATDAQSAGETITLEPHADKKAAALAVVTSSPDSASITIDGQPQGFSPILAGSIAAGDHEVVVSAPGFTTRNITLKTVEGYKLSLNVKLAGEPISLDIVPTPAESATVSGTPKPTTKTTPTPKPTGTAAALDKPYVEIKDTPVGFLRVRSGPSTSSSEIGQVQPGDTFPLTGSASGWYLIEVDLPATSSGWISAQYADKFE